jgi:hypothetical protein
MNLVFEEERFIVVLIYHLVSGGELCEAATAINLGTWFLLKNALL